MRGATTPGSNTEGGQGEVKGDRGESRYRAAAARGNYLGQDRMRVQFAAPERSRFMSKPKEQDWRAAKRLARYTKAHLRVVLEYRYQNVPGKVVVWSDTDFAGRARIRRSTSGGVVTFGTHCLKTHSQTQETIAVSSGESEFYGIAKAATMGIGIKSSFKDLGLKVEIQVKTDSSTAISISFRRGAGRVRRVEVGELWVQERGELSIIKVRGEDNVADGLPKQVE
jgi:hypothetical protein